MARGGRNSLLQLDGPVQYSLQGRVFRDSDGARIGGDIAGTHADVSVGDLTLTGAYNSTAQLLERLEVRQDWSNRKVFFEGNAGADKNQTTLALQIIYTF